MTKVEANDLDLLTEDELASALSLLAPPENARATAAAVAAIPADERRFYRWAYEVVLAASGVSVEIARRNREHYGSTPEEQARMATEQRVFRSWRVATADAPITVAFALEEVVIDTRCPGIGLDRAYSVPTALPTTGR
ncbi:MAG TPA: hypothetical protein VFE05_17585 [Longimicrobiaceae bacterium]|nr:hypothetical protein [Longimicrobiaceae bacterium]